ncbi:MAG TPA: glycosyltransferase [Chitinispirillaceae bacterium]|nr:glycosyltransferase [Chitinispirillaceae bacterium]
MKLNTILSVAFPFARIKEDTVGGAEQILSSLDNAITNRGYNSIVIASEGSNVKGELFAGPPVPDSIVDQQIRERTYKIYRKLISNVARIRNADVIHFHGVDFDKYLPSIKIPVLVTLHLPVPWYNHEFISENKKNIYFNCVSGYQNSTCDNIHGLLGAIDNGIPVPLQPLRCKRCNFTLSMGRVCPEKGYHIAFDAAKKAKLAHLHAGKVFPYIEHIKYYREQILPRCDNFRYRFIGSAGISEKKRLLCSARCLLIPSLVQETSSLVALEAMAYGTPVIAFRAGALNEIVKDGYNGYLVNDEKEMAEAINMTHLINSCDCYRYVKEKYSIDKMVNQYFQLYSRLTEYNGSDTDNRIDNNSKTKKCA